MPIPSSKDHFLHSALKDASPQIYEAPIQGVDDENLVSKKHV